MESELVLEIRNKATSKYNAQVHVYLPLGQRKIILATSVGASIHAMNIGYSLVLLDLS